MTDDRFVFDKRAADVAVAFFDRLLRHTKGEWAGQPFTLQGWQRDDIIRPLFGWKRKDGSRRYRQAYIEIPRKNGKSTLSAGIALALLLMDNEPGAEVYSAAADRAQAAIVFDEAKRMVENSPSLSRFAEPYRREIRVPKINGTYKVLSADAYTKHGLNAHGIVFDELHAQPNRDLWDVLNTSTGARRQPMMVMITTAGYDRNSLCWEQHEYARQVLNGNVDDQAYFAYIAAADEGDDWTDPVIWAKANPGLGVTVKVDYLQAECDRAKQVPAYQNTFRRLHLNQWTTQESRFLDMTYWDACGKPLPDLAGRACYGGLDLATTTDIAAFVLVFPPHEDGEPFWVLPRFFIPQDNMIERVRRDRVPYDVWQRQGLLVATPGNVIDYTYIEAEIARLAAQYEIREIAFDRWGAAQMSQRLTDADMVMVQFGQGYASMSAPTKEMLRLVLSQEIGHAGNPVLRWMADNMAVQQDAAGNVKPDKAKSTQRIDGMVAAIMALDRATRNMGETSVYEERGIRTL
jgi:phage terminase large subunit-like protein